MYNHHLAVSVFISNMPQRTTKGCQLNTVLDKQLVVHNYFSHQQKKRPQLMISGALNKKREKRVGGKRPLSSPEKSCWVSHLCFSSLQLDLQLIYLSGVAPWIPRIPGFTTRLWWMKSAAVGRFLGIHRSIKPSKIATPTRISRYHNNRLSLN